MRVAEIIAVLERFSPVEYAESYDNVGLLVGDSEAECKGIILGLDLTLELIEEAERLECNLIITHHPIFFKPLKKLNYQNYEGRLVQALLSKKLHLYVLHTNWDRMPKGVSYGIANKIGLENLEFILNSRINSELTIGYGIWGNLPEPMKTEDFLFKIKELFVCQVIRHSRLVHSQISRIGVCGGSGGFLIEKAYEHELDILLTADLKYHDFFPHKDTLIICDIGHYESEQFAMQEVYEYLQINFLNFAIFESKTCSNPVYYFI